MTAQSVSSHLQRGVHEVASAAYAIFNSVENLQFLQKVITFGGMFFSTLAKHPINPQVGLGKLTSMIGSTNLLINGTQAFTFLPGLFVTTKKGQVPQKMVEIDGVVHEVNQAKRNEKIGTTPFLYDLKHKPQKAIATIGFLGAYLTSTISLFEALKVPVLSSIEAGIGMIPVVGRALGQGFVAQIFNLGGFVLIAAHTALVFDSLRYIYLATGDSSKSMSKGILQLVARVASLSLDILLVVGVSNPYAVGAIGLAAGALGIASVIYNNFRRNQKAAEQEALLQKATIQPQISVKSLPAAV